LCLLITKSFSKTMLGKRIEKEKEPSKIMQKIRREEERIKKNISVGQSILNKNKVGLAKPADSSFSGNSRGFSNGSESIKNNSGKNGESSSETVKKKALDPAKIAQIEKQLDMSRNYEKYINDPNFNVGIDLFLSKEIKSGKNSSGLNRTIIIDANKPKIDPSKFRVADIEKAKPKNHSRFHSIIEKITSKGKKGTRTYKIPGEPTVWCAKCKKEHARDFHKPQIQESSSTTKMIHSINTEHTSKPLVPTFTSKPQQKVSNKAQIPLSKGPQYSEVRTHSQKPSRPASVPVQHNRNPPSQRHYPQPQNYSSRFERSDEEDEELYEDEELDDFIVEDEKEYEYDPLDHSQIRRMVHQSIGYNPHKYAHNDDRDLGDMEARFDDISREERFSSRVAREEDERELRYIQMEEERERGRAEKRKKYY